MQSSKPVTPDKALALIREEKENRTRHLDLESCHLTAIPVELLEMDWLTSLCLRNNAIKKIENLENLVNLRFLELDGNKIESINGLNTLAKLEELNISDNRIGEIKNIERLVSLRHLNFSRNKITEVPDFPALPNLDFSNLKRNTTISLQALTSIKKEKEQRTGSLNLESSELAEIPVELLQMDWLSALCLRNNAIKKIENLENLINLRSLELDNNKIAKIEGLGTLTKLEHLNISDNKIDEIENIGHLTGLRQLKISQNKIKQIKNLDTLTNLDFLNLKSNHITEITGLDPLVSLITLHLGHNQINEIKNLDHLVNLKVLYLNDNAISKLKNLNSLANLGALYLDNNQITEIENINRLYKLHLLSLTSNRITAIKNINKLRSLQTINLGSNPVTTLTGLFRLINSEKLACVFIDRMHKNDLNIPPEIFGGPASNSVKALRGYFASLEKGRFELKELPVILVGNSTAGKTSLRYFLQQNIFPPPLDHSTHGIEPSIWQPDDDVLENIREKEEVKDIQFYFWDFGGQEYYHATHRLFFCKKAIYIIVWERKTNQQAIEKIPVKILKQNGNIETCEMPVELFPYEYWFNSIRHMAFDVKESPIFLLQNKIDEPGNEKKINPDPDLIEKNNCEVMQVSIKTAYGTIAQGKRDPYIDILLEKFFSAANQLASTTVYGALWDKLKKMLQNARDENIWSPEKLLAELRAFDPEVQEESMISYALSLRAMGFIIYNYEDAFLKNYIFINPGWVTEIIYSILDYGVLENQGEFTRHHVIQKAGMEHADIFIALMKKFELIFENDELDAFIAPQYLPAALNDRRKISELKTRFDFDKPDFVLEFSDFMPRHIMLRFLAAYGKLTAGRYFWKNGIAFTFRDCIVLVLCDYAKKQFKVFTENNNRFVQRLVFEKLVQLSENTDALSMACGNGDFVAYHNLSEEFPSGKFSGNRTVKSQNGNRVLIQDFLHFFEPIESTKKNNPILPGMVLGPKKIKVFISYAHADNESGLVDLFVRELKGQLKALEDNYVFNIFKDDQIIMGSHWDSILQKEVIIADVAILLLSSSFLESQYIKKNELAVFLEKNTHTGNAILAPIYFNPFMFNRYTLLKPFQFFKPLGKTYGPDYAHLNDDLCYSDLVKFDPQSGLPMPAPNRSRYIIDFVEQLEKAIDEKFGIRE